MKTQSFAAICSDVGQLARVRGGLMPMSYPVNPEREYKTGRDGGGFKHKFLLLYTLKLLVQNYRCI